MGDPVWLDNSVLDNALKGDAAINQQLTNYRKAGRPLLVVPAAAAELLDGNVVKGTPGPAPEFRKAMEQGMAKLGVKVDMMASKLPAGTTLADLYKTGSENVSLSDRRVLNQIKFSAQARGIAAPEMITAEVGKKAMMSQASKWGIKAVSAATPAPGSVPAPPRVDLAEEYPPEKPGPISRFFKDRPVLKKLGLVGANIAAQLIKSAMFKEVQDHFVSVLRDAEKELESKYPDPEQLKAKAGLEGYQKAYMAALSKFRTPTVARGIETFILTFTKQRDIDRVKKILDDQITKVQSAADGTQSGFAKVATEYIDAMIALHTQLNPYGGLGEIAADVRKRGAVLKSTGKDLEEAYLKYGAISAAFPVAYYQWMDVYTVAEQFQNLGQLVLSFAFDVQARYELSQSIQKQLEDELTKVSEMLGRLAP